MDCNIENVSVNVLNNFAIIDNEIFMYIIYIWINNNVLSNKVQLNINVLHDNIRLIDFLCNYEQWQVYVVIPMNPYEASFKH